VGDGTPPCGGGEPVRENSILPNSNPQKNKFIPSINYSTTQPAGKRTKEDAFLNGDKTLSKQRGKQ